MVSEKGQYWDYYERKGRGKNKKYRCLFCGYELPKYSSIISHIERTHRPEINEIEREKQEEKECKRRAEEFAEQQLRWWKINLPRIKKQRKLEEKRQEEQRKIEEEERRREEARKIEIWNKVQKANEESKRAKQQKENIRKLFAYHVVFEKEKPSLEDFYLYYLSG